MGNTEARYHRVEQDAFEDVEIDNARNFDCVMVFDIGSAEKDWRVPADGSEIQYDYLKLLDTPDLENRKKQFPQHGADFAASRTKEKDFYRNERKLVIKALTKLNVKCKHIGAMTKEFETEQNLKFYYVGIGEATSRSFADKIHYELELDPQAAISYLQLMDESLAVATVSDEDDSKHCVESLWKNMYIKFNKHVTPEVYKPYDVLDSEDQKEGFEDSLFRIRDRLALINEIVTQDVVLGGCGIFVPQLSQKDHCIVDFYPLHTLEHLEDILSKLFSWKSFTYGLLSLPLEEIRAYFGEYIGIYFAYLQFMTIYFVPLAALGFVLQFYQWIEGIVLVEGIQYFAILVVLWSVCFPIFWKRKEINWAMKWGTLRFDLCERPRPEFSGEYRKSNVHGGVEEYFPFAIRNTRRMITFAVVVSFIIALFGSVFLVILLRVYVAETGIDYGTYFISVANAFVIMFFNNIYGIFAEKLNSWENYKTETEYENNLIIKIFIFRFINSYATLYYIAFFRRYESTSSSLYCDAEDCMEDLAAQLGTIFITQLTVSNVLELGALFVSRLVKRGGSTLTYFIEDEKISIWAQYSSETYERTFDDYCEILVSFGYATLFVISFPLAPFAAFIGCVVEARIDGYKLCKLTRRPIPRQADDVGTWQLAMEVMGWAVLVTNLLIICFSAADLDFTFLGISDTWFQETLTALILFAFSFIVVQFLNYCIASAPRYISVHMERQSHIESSMEHIGVSIDRYLDSLSLSDLESWREWSAHRLSLFFKEIIYKNAAQFNIVSSAIHHCQFSGHELECADEHLLEKKLGITDHLHIRFILNARRILDEQTEKAKKQMILFEQSEQEESIRLSGGSRITDERKQFHFTNDNLLKMAEFFEEDLTGQSKRKLWGKVDKDQSKLIEKDELENFLYFSCVVYIKAKHHNVKLPKKSDAHFKKRILKPLEMWLLHHKIAPNGLEFDEFDVNFSSWLREYYRKQVKIPIKSDRSESKAVKVSSKLSKLFGIKKEEEEEEGKELLPLITPRAISTNDDEDGTIFDAINRGNWSPESLEWEKKLESVANAVNKTDISTRKKIWDKFDRRNVEKLDCDKSLPRLIYSLIALYIKTKNREAKPPKFTLLQPLLQSVCNDIKKMNKGNHYITKHDFETHIAVYLKKIAKERKSKIAITAEKIPRKKKRRT